MKYVMKNRGVKAVDVIKTIRRYTGRGLKESKELSEIPDLVLNNIIEEEFVKELADELISLGAEVLAVEQ